MHAGALWQDWDLDQGSAMLRRAIAGAGTLAASVWAVQFIDQAVTRHAAAPDQPMTAVAAAPFPTRSHRLVIRAGQGGHFAVDGRVDGRAIGFLIDTGASHIALRASD